MARPKKQEEHAHSESWLVSYCDMISLLVTFFLMMMTFSTSNQHNMTEAGVGLLKGRGGVWKNQLAFPLESTVDLAQLNVFAREMCSLMSVMGGGQPMTVKPIQDGFTIGFDLDASFAPGSDEVTPALRKELLRVGRVLSRFGFAIIVEGYTDSLFRPTRYYTDDIAMGLSRAREAATVLLDGCAIPSERVFVSSFGSLRPRAPNETPTGRTSNRRVELRVVPTIRRSTPSQAGGQFEERQK
ncbi:MAG: flagellar motor protein MotB [Planctomycetota bacterium]|nr:flagellar motor protein MotB [Planctomycetota bacterium]